jgi:hypothetical protein
MIKMAKREKTPDLHRLLLRYPVDLPQQVLRKQGEIQEDTRRKGLKRENVQWPPSPPYNPDQSPE